MLFYYGLIVYVILITITFNNIESKNKAIVVYLTMPVLWFVSAFRNYSIGNDTLEYLRVFDLVKNTDSIFLFTDRYEVGYLVLNKMVSFFTSNPVFIIVVSSTIIYIGFSRFIIKFSKNPGFSVLLFILMGYFAQSLNLIRFQLACTFLLFAFEKLSENKNKSFVFIVLFAFLFHKTAIIFLLALPLKYLKLNTKNLSFIGISTVIVYILFDPVFKYITNLFNYYIDYSSTAYFDGEIRLASILYFLITISILLFVYFIRNNNEKYFEKSKYEDFMIMLLFVGACILLLSFKFNLLDRVSDYFRVYSIVLIPNILLFVKDKYRRLIYSLLICLLFLVYFSFIHISRPEWNNIYPYETWLKGM